MNTRNILLICLIFLVGIFTNSRLSYGAEGLSLSYAGDDLCRDVLLPQTFDYRSSEYQKFIFANSINKSYFEDSGHSAALSALGEIYGVPIKVDGSYDDFEKSLSVLSTQLNINWDINQSVQIARIYLNSDQIAAWTTCMANSPGSRLYIARDPDQSVVSGGRGQPDVLYLSLVWHPGADLGTDQGLHLDAPRVGFGDVDTTQLLSHSGSQSYDFLAAGQRLFTAKTDQDGRFSITFQGWTTNNATMPARLTLAAHPTISPVSLSTYCKATDSSPFRYCTRCEVPLQQLTVAPPPANGQPGTVEESCRVMKPGAVIHVTLDGKATCAGNAKAMTIGLTGPGFAKDMLTPMSGGQDAHVNLFGDDKAGLDGNYSVTIQNKACTVHEDDANPQPQSREIQFSSGTLVIEQH